MNQLLINDRLHNYTANLNYLPLLIIMLATTRGLKYESGVVGLTSPPSLLGPLHNFWPTLDSPPILWNKSALHLHPVTYKPWVLYWTATHLLPGTDLDLLSFLPASQCWRRWRRVQVPRPSEASLTVLRGSSSDSENLVTRSFDNLILFVPLTPVHDSPYRFDKATIQMDLSPSWSYLKLRPHSCYSPLPFGTTLQIWQNTL